MNEFSSCLKCGQQTPLVDARFCAVCGGRMLSSQKARKLGWVGVIAGVAMVGIVVFIVLWATLSDAHWEGSAEMGVLAIILGILLFALGVVSILGGRWQIKYGARNKTLAYITFVLAGALVAVAIAIKRLR